MTTFDALVVGAGISGCAAALELRQSGWKVGLLHRQDRVAAIESLSPMAVRQLAGLSVTTGVALNRVVAWWGSDHEAHANHEGAGIVQRIILAEALRSRAVEAGAEVLEEGRVTGIEKLSAGWEVRHEVAPECCRKISARYLVDATGRASIIGRRLGARRTTSDKLFSLSASVSGLDLVGTWTESVSDGWWNLCSTGSEGTLSFYSIASVVRGAGEDFATRYSRTRHIRQLLPAPTIGECAIRASGSSRLVPSAGIGWISVGDAASTLQPLASAGITKALRDSRIVQHTLEDDPDNYNQFQRTEFMLYLRELNEHYRLERRWPDNPFWATSLDGKRSYAFGGHC